MDTLKSIHIFYKLFQLLPIVLLNLTQHVQKLPARFAAHDPAE
jgi:hypothetical protein